MQISKSIFRMIGNIFEPLATGTDKMTSYDNLNGPANFRDTFFSQKFHVISNLFNSR